MNDKQIAEIDLLALLHQLADASGQAIMPHYRTALVVDNKMGDAGFDPVTHADRAAELVMRQLLAQIAPHHGIIGEEFGRKRDDAKFVWVLDPIDGTRAFMSAMPTWGTLIALLEDGQAVFGAVDQPFLKERFFGNGEQSWMRSASGQSLLRTRETANLESAIVWVSSTFTANPVALARVERLRDRVKLLRYGSDCYAYPMLAAGHIDAVIDTGLEIYDIAAHLPVIAGAGGSVLGLDGEPPLKSSGIIAASKGWFADQLQEILAAS